MHSQENDYLPVVSPKNKFRNYFKVFEKNFFFNFLESFTCKILLMPFLYFSVARKEQFQQPEMGCWKCHRKKNDKGK